MSAFEKVIGYKDIKNELKRICDVMKNPEKYLKLGVTTPKLESRMVIGCPKNLWNTR